MSKTRSRRPSSRSARRSNSSVASPASSQAARHGPVARAEPAAAAAVGEDHEAAAPAAAPPGRRAATPSLDVDVATSTSAARARRACRLGEQREHLVVGDLAEVPVPLARRRGAGRDACGRRPRRRLAQQRDAPRASRPAPPRRSAPRRARRSARTAARSVRPVASPSSTTITVRPRTSGGGAAVAEELDAAAQLRALALEERVAAPRRVTPTVTRPVRCRGRRCRPRPPRRSPNSGLRRAPRACGPPGRRAARPGRGPPRRPPARRRAAGASTIGRSDANRLSRSARWRPASRRSSKMPERFTSSLPRDCRGSWDFIVALRPGAAVSTDSAAPRRPVTCVPAPIPPSGSPRGRLSRRPSDPVPRARWAILPRRPRGARADVAQLAEHFTRNEGVRGSSPRVGFLRKPVGKRHLARWHSTRRARWAGVATVVATLSARGLVAQPRDEMDRRRARRTSSGGTAGRRRPTSASQLRCWIAVQRAATALAVHLRGRSRGASSRARGAINGPWRLKASGAGAG